MRHALNGTAVNSLQTHLGMGATALALASSADSIVANAKIASGAVAQSLAASSHAIKATLRTADSALALSLSGSVASVKLAQAGSTLYLTAKNGIPYKAIPDGFLGNMAERRMLVERDSRKLRVAADAADASRLMRIPEDDRRLHVGAEYDLALMAERPLRLARETRRV